MTIFTINLEKDRKKKAYIEKQAQLHGLDIEVIKAIDGHDLEEDILNQVYSKQKSLKYFSRELTRGEIGTALSHLSIYKTMIAQNLPMALVLEDDVSLHFMGEDLCKLTEALPEDWECVLLGHHTKRSQYIDTLPSFWGKHKVTDTLHCTRVAEEAFGAYAYLINTKGALKSLHHFNVIDRPIDHWNDSVHNLYAISPSVVKVNSDFVTSSSLAFERDKAGEKINRTLFQKLKDSIRFFLEKFNLSDIYYIIRNFIVQFKILKRYHNNG